MSNTPAQAESPPKGRKLPAILLVVACLGAGFASSFLGFWSPLGLFSGHETKAPAPELPAVQFVSLPQTVLSLPGPQMRMLIMSIQIETDQAHRAQVEYLVPRLSDAFNGFLAEIDPTAFERRGILDIVRDELATRAVYVLGKDAFSDILITEFRIQ